MNTRPPNKTYKGNNTLVKSGGVLVRPDPVLPPPLNPLQGTTSQAPGSPLPLLPTAPNTAPNPADTFNSAIIHALTNAQGLNTADLLARKRQLERQYSDTVTETTPEQYRTFAPDEQAALRGGEGRKVVQAIDDNAYQLEKAQQSIDNFFRISGEALKLGQEYADKISAPDSVIENAAKLIEANPDATSTILAGFNEKSREKILGKVDYTSFGKGKDTEIDTIEHQGSIYNKKTGEFIKTLSPDSGTGGKSPSNYTLERASRTVSSVDDLLDEVTGMTTGIGAALSVLPMTASRDFKAKLVPLKASIAQNELTQMREASKTGGALGNVSDREINLLENSLGALDRYQSPTQFKQELQKIKDSIVRWQTAVNQYSGDSQSSGDSDEAEYLRGKGYSEDTIKQLVGFNTAGNATASKLSVAIAGQESGNDYSAINKTSGALGKYQMMPATLRGLGYKVTQQQFLSDPDIQEEAHSKLLAELDTRYKGNVDKILADYYGGPKMASIVGTPAGDKPQGNYPSINKYVAQVKSRLNLV